MRISLNTVLLVLIAVVAAGSIHHFGVIEGLALTAAVWILMPYPVRP